MISDGEMHKALCDFLAANQDAIPYSPAAVSFVDQGLFTTVRRMRTVLRARLPNYPNAASIELRGRWSYPVMMMNDCIPRDPDPPAILILDGSGTIVRRFAPTTAEQVHEILAARVFDVANYSAQVAAKLLEEEKAAYLEARRAELKDDLRLSVASGVAQCEPEIQALAKALCAKLGPTTVNVCVDMGEHRVTPLLQAYDGGLCYGAQAVAKEVERRVYLGIMKGFNI